MTTWLISDLHFGHAALVTGLRDEPPLRPTFDTVERMDAGLLDAYNQVVRPQDRAYILGDIAWRRKDLAMVRRMHGHKRLVGGNHDVLDTKDYLAAGFQKVYGMRVLDCGLALTHAPIHRNSMRWRGNIHGHLHRAKAPVGPYLNVSCEVLDYKPISLEDASVRIDALRKAEQHGVHTDEAVRNELARVIDTVHEALAEMAGDVTLDMGAEGCGAVFAELLADIAQDVPDAQRQEFLDRALDGVRINTNRHLSVLLAGDAEVVG